MSTQSHTILKVLVGSHAHGLATEESDRDYRRVYVIPTEDMFHLGFKPPTTHWTKGDNDETAWEIGPFLLLATQCHPLVLETLLAPVVMADRWGEDLRSLFSVLWSPHKALEAFTNYAHNQRTKLLKKKDERPAKYAAAFIRVLYNLCELLETGQFSIDIAQTPMGQQLFDIKQGQYRLGDVIELGEELMVKAQYLVRTQQDLSDLGRINAFLVTIRRAFLVPHPSGQCSE